MEVLIASLPDRDNLVAEIWIGDCQLAEIVQRGDEQLVEMYPHPGGGPWQMALPELLGALQHARARLDELLLR